MVNWQVTATTVYCDAVDGEVTLMVYKDGSGKCVSFERYGKPNKEMAKLMRKKGKELGRKLECAGPECQGVTRYRDKLFAEEAGISGSD